MCNGETVKIPYEKASESIKTLIRAKTKAYNMSGARGYLEPGVLGIERIKKNEPIDDKGGRLCVDPLN